MSDQQSSQDQLAALLEKGKQEKQLTEVEIAQVVGDLNSEVGQMILEQLDDAGVVVLTPDTDDTDETNLADVDDTDDIDDADDTTSDSDSDEESEETSPLKLQETLSELGIAERLAESSIAESSSSSSDDDYTDDVVALADDPVRMYLKEIGQVELLDSNRETWLSVQIAAVVFLNQLRDDLADENEMSEASPLMVMSALYRNIIDGWNRVEQGIEGFDAEMPDFELFGAEAINLRYTWDEDAPSYVRMYLSHEAWGRNDAWNAVATAMFDVFHAFYLLPEVIQTRLINYYTLRDDLPSSESFAEWLTSDAEFYEDAASQEFTAAMFRGNQAAEVLTRANPAFGGKHGQTLYRTWHQLP